MKGQACELETFTESKSSLYCRKMICTLVYQGDFGEQGSFSRLLDRSIAWVLIRCALIEWWKCKLQHIATQENKVVLNLSRLLNGSSRVHGDHMRMLVSIIWFIMAEHSALGDVLAHHHCALTIHRSLCSSQFLLDWLVNCSSALLWNLGLSA